jgi:predicted O-methyltransferase YrrM
VVEFGTSFGISTIFLASAIRDNGSGKIITTEFEPEKAEQATRNLAAAGLEQWVEFRVGDALETLSEPPREIDMIFLDGAKGLYFGVLKLLEPQLRSGGIVASDNTDRDGMAAFLDYIRDCRNGYTSAAIDDEQQRVRWSNFPTGFVPRGGLSLEELSDTQQKAALALVASTLSQKNFEKVEEIREADDVFKTTPHQHPPFGNNKDGGPGHSPFGGAKDGPPGPSAGGGFKSGDQITRCLAKTSTIFPSWERLWKKTHGCCSSAVTTWRLTSPSWEIAAFSLPVLPELNLGRTRLMAKQCVRWVRRTTKGSPC